MNPAALTMEQLIPHRPPMQLLDNLLAIDDEGLWASVKLTPSSPFAEPDGVFASTGIEYLGQATAAFFTLRQLQRAAYSTGSLDQPPPMGMLIGSRSYQSAAGFFPVPGLLLVHVAISTSAALSSSLVKFVGTVWSTQDSAALERLAGIDGDLADLNHTATVAKMANNRLAYGDLSVFIPPTGQLPQPSSR